MGLVGVLPGSAALGAVVYVGDSLEARYGGSGYRGR